MDDLDKRKRELASNQDPVLKIEFLPSSNLVTRDDFKKLKQLSLSKSSTFTVIPAKAGIQTLFQIAGLKPQKEGLKMEQKLSRAMIPTLILIASLSFSRISGILIDVAKIISPEPSRINVLASIFATEWLILMAIISCAIIGVLAKIFTGNYAYLLPIAIGIPTIFYLGAFWATNNPLMWLALVVLSALVFLFFGSFFEETK